jgi:hypothetical protein
VSAVDWDEVFSSGDTAAWGSDSPDWQSWKETYRPDAGIVNFYQLNVKQFFAIFPRRMMINISLRIH